jgi:hypothetical protein
MDYCDTCSANVGPLHKRNHPGHAVRGTTKVNLGGYQQLVAAPYESEPYYPRGSVIVTLKAPSLHEHFVSEEVTARLTPDAQRELVARFNLIHPDDAVSEICTKLKLVPSNLSAKLYWFAAGNGLLTGIAVSGLFWWMT